MMKNTLKNPSILLTENKIGLIVVIVKTNNPPEVVNNASKNKYFQLTRFIMKIKQKEPIIFPKKNIDENCPKLLLSN